jgi:DNA-directed RNA polymerase subunit K/omega
MANIKPTRSSDVDVEKCVKTADNRFDLIIGASQRLRELKSRTRENGGFASAVDPLLEVQNGNLDIQEYLLKVK